MKIRCHVCVYGSTVAHNVNKVNRWRVNTVKTETHFEHGKLSGVYIAEDWITIWTGYAVKVYTAELMEFLDTVHSYNYILSFC